jgi:HlyD family secretion protein
MRQKMNNKKKLSLGILVLILVGVGYAIMRPKPVIKTVTNPPMIVTMATATPKNVTETVTINGTIAPRDDIIISTELTGLRVLSVSADEGDTVKKGQILAVLDNNMLINDGRQLKADLDKAAADYQRAQSMIKNGAISREKFDERQANFQSLKARYDNNLLQQKRTNLTAPVNGIIYRRQINAGDLIQGNQILFNIAARGESELAGAVPEAILSRIAIEGAADILLTGREQPIKGTIRMIAPRINNTSRTAEIRLRLPKDVFIPIGSFG